MYAKLFRNNIKKALRDYVIYFFTLVISSTLFFAFLSLTSRYNDILGGDGNYSLALFQNTIRYAVLAISVIFVALIRYINNYMLKQRSREFSVYMILVWSRAPLQSTSSEKPLCLEWRLWPLGALWEQSCPGL